MAIIIKQADAWVFRRRVQLSIALLLPAALLAVFSRPFAYEGSWADVGFDTFGWVLFLMGGILRVWATLYIGARKRRVLVTEGPYSLCRNPLYVGTLLIALSAVVFLQSFVLLIAVGMAMLLYGVGIVREEERALAESFGPAYLAYRRDTPRYFPSLSHFETSQTLEINIRALGRELLRAASWLWIPFVCEILALLRAQPWWPTPIF